MNEIKKEKDKKSQSSNRNEKSSHLKNSYEEDSKEKNKEKKSKDNIDDFKNEIQALKNEIQESQNLLVENEDFIKRQQAEFFNYRKRVNEEKQKMSLYAGENLIKGFLSIYDNFITALEVKTDDENTLAFLEGFKLLKQDMDRFLEENNVSPSTKIGDEFNPNIHKAIQIDESDKIEVDRISEIFQQGFLMSDRMIREATVKIEKAKAIK